MSKSKAKKKEAKRDAIANTSLGIGLAFIATSIFTATVLYLFLHPLLMLPLMFIVAVLAALSVHFILNGINYYKKLRR